MEILFSDIVNLIQILLWPIVLLLFLAVYRDSIRKALENMRVKKFSFLNLVDVELREVTELKARLTGGGPIDVHQLVQRPYLESNLGDMLSQLQDPSASDCAVIDLGEGKEWITSRLFILSFLLKQLRNTRCFVFVKTQGNQQGTYVGNSTPEHIQDAIVRLFPEYATHMDSILQAFPYDTSLYKTRSGIRGLPTTAHDLGPIMSGFVNLIKLYNQPPTPPPDPSKWVELQTNQYELASWIDEYQIRRMMGEELNEFSVIRNADTSDEDLIKKVLVSHDEFVATVDSNHKYLRLIDRRELLEQISRMIGYSQ